MQFNRRDVVQLVLALLVGASVISWAIIFRKRSLLRTARAEAESFESSFWSGGDLGSLYRTIQNRGGSTGMSSISARTAWCTSMSRACGMW